LLLIILVGISFFIVQPMLKAVFLGALLAYILYPLYNWLSLKTNKTISATLICLFVLIIIVLPSVLFVKTLIQESYVIFILIKQKLATGLFSGCQHSLCESLKGLSNNPEFNYQVQETAKTITNWVVQKSSGFLVSIPKMILNLFIMFFTLFYALKEGHNFMDKVEKYLRIQKKEYVKALKRLKQITHGITYGYLIIALIQGILGALGFFIFGISSPLFWGLLMAFLALIPFLGTGIIWVPASLFLFLEGLFQGSTSLMVKGVLLFVYCLIFVSTLDNFIRPKLMGGEANIHPLIVMLGIFGGLFVFGALGVVIGPLILSFTFVLVENYFLKK
jgi:predicted PurR-regulated permease PerM